MLKNHKIKYLGVLNNAESGKHIKRADNKYLKNWEIAFSLDNSINGKLYLFITLFLLILPWASQSAQFEFPIILFIARIVRLSAAIMPFFDLILCISLDCKLVSICFSTAWTHSSLSYKQRESSQTIVIVPGKLCIKLATTLDHIDLRIFFCSDA